MSNKKWGNYSQGLGFAPDAEEIKNVQELLDRPYSCTDFSPAARCAVQMYFALCARDDMKPSVAGMALVYRKNARLLTFIT